MMPDLTQVPSYLQVLQLGVTRDNGIQTNVNLRYGEVKELLLPTDSRNQNGRFIEYYVDVVGKDDFGARTTVRYQGCQLVNLFGGPGDLVRYTLRPGIANDTAIGPGAKVLLLCIDGEQTRAIILGGIRDSFGNSNLPEGIDKNLGHNYFWEFNGAQQTVDKDGQLQFTFSGATNVDGSLADSAQEDAQGSSMLFDKTGGIKIGGPDDDQSLYLDHAGKQYNVLVNDWNATVSGKLAFEVTDQAKIATEAGMLLQAVDNITMLSAGLRVGAATDAPILGTTFRAAMANMNSQLKSAAAQASSALNVAASQITAGASQASLPSAKPMFTAAAVAIAQAATALNAIASAIASFEGQADTYLSQVNLSD